jgi:hypothetical protein
LSGRPIACSEQGVLAPNSDFLAFTDIVLARNSNFLAQSKKFLASNSKFPVRNSKFLAPNKNFLAFTDTDGVFCDKMAVGRINGGAVMKDGWFQLIIFFLFRALVITLVFKRL